MGTTAHEKLFIALSFAIALAPTAHAAPAPKLEAATASMQASEHYVTSGTTLVSLPIDVRGKDLDAVKLRNLTCGFTIASVCSN